MIRLTLLLLLSLSTLIPAQQLSPTHLIEISSEQQIPVQSHEHLHQDKEEFIDRLVKNMTIADLGEYRDSVFANAADFILVVLQLHLMFADDIVGQNSDNGLYSMLISLHCYTIVYYRCTEMLVSRLHNAKCPRLANRRNA